MTDEVRDAMWAAVWEQRKKGAGEELDAPTVAHWLRLPQDS